MALQSHLVQPLPPDEIGGRRDHIRARILVESRTVRVPDFEALHTDDLWFLFDGYDALFFGESLRATLPGPLKLRLSGRMTRTGGITRRFQDRRTGAQSFDIGIAWRLIMDSFGPASRDVTAVGLPCSDRLDALMRIFEHELVHLAELVAWGDSDCAGPRFAHIASGRFGHRAHTHQLVTRREHAARVHGVRVGSPVRFELRGQPLSGRVNRINTRATVLVPDPKGARYSDGGRYAKYYVPLSELTPIERD